MSKEQVEVYAENTGKISSAIQSVVKTDGWKLFIALFRKRENEIKDKSDYASLEDFKADRTAIDIVEGIIEEFEGYIEDAEALQLLLKSFSTDNPQDRGIMLIEQQEKSVSIEG